MTDLQFNPFESDKPQVLVVDDDPDINRLLQVRLRNVGFAVRSAPDGESALEEIERRVPDVILLDISMPGISGLEVLERVRKDGLDVAVIMTTAFGSESVAIDSLRQGADDYLRKPFEPEEFRAVIDRTMSRLGIRRQAEQERKQLDDELSHALIIQRSLLPDWTPDLAGYDVASMCMPAEAVGGNFYDWNSSDDDSLAFVVGEVMGKGLSAAILMATVRASLKPLVRTQDPATAINTLTDSLQDDLARTRTLVSMFVGSLDARNHTVTYVDAGHGLAALIRANGSGEVLTGTDVPLGIFPDTHYYAFQVVLDPGDTLVIYSDSLRNAINERDFPTVASRVREADSAAAAIDEMIQFAGGAAGWTDDVTIVVMRREHEGENG